jgi:hypothetical protein
LLLVLVVAPSAVGAAAFPESKKKEEKPYALLFATVWGPDDLPIYGMPVLIRRERDKHARWQLVSNHRGEAAQRVPAGKEDYVIWADVKAYNSLNKSRLGQVPEIKIHVEFDERVDFSLHLK